ncbi:MAG: type I glyceraldehyde-3-phosphate dehydrogenase [Acidobacteria bacterium 13_1_40CM_4_57_6]|nr:MAG: type I glyceraldehyde-3-phosphate dehydrogenase [Acidobacteria bacterium 13_1_40CM_4_57_6]
MTTIAINGLGRIGRAAFKIILETPELELRAVNDLNAADDLAYLLNYDSVYGRYHKKVAPAPDGLTVDGKTYPVFREKDPARLPWRKLEIDIVLECTGVFNQQADLERHLAAGAKTVILSAPAKSPEIATVVHGANSTHEPTTGIISCASCTTNCITPVVEVMGRRIGVQKAIMTTVHAYTATQAIVDRPNKRRRRGRAAAVNLIPASTGAAIATTKALPQYAGKFDGIAVRVPVAIGSLADIVFLTSRRTTAEEVNTILTEEANSERYRGVLGVTDEPLVSSDIIQDPRASVVDLELTQVVDGNLVKVMSWYDNEWGYTSQMIREAVRIGKASKSVAARH